MTSSVAVLRQQYIDQMEWAIPVYKIMLATLPAAEILIRQDGGDGWTALEVICHLRDYEKLSIQRLTLTLEADNPTMPGMDAAALAIENRYNHQDLLTVLDDWSTARAEYLAIQRESREEQWARAAQHPKRGALNLTDQLGIIVWHDMNHMQQLSKIINGS